MVKANKSLKTRQALRAHFEEEQQKLRDRKKKLNSLLSLIDQRENLNEKIGHASRAVIDLGEPKELVRELIGVSQRDFNDMLKTAKESSPGDDESHTGNDKRQYNDEAASATDNAGGDGADENSGQ
ncbi:3-deoxy-D-manno-octulosonate 8-phosphate phosphatase [Corynebacterium sp. c8Ua_181]|uniref:3-deoxy-D-manno-octulosonate 8-phosphate phosphatase n=1 Tax=Corynebacterium curieae TaxID=2913500 RepID=A0A9X3MBN1_9CORY|nr:3-deoxy-D-manno-octulosonate 8-phosphate phosphatase [Corynebacterium curieae]MCZ9307962.1 3-deoxy-D-manno-octulosonate 8-phosphate phosphatase [Corynebacterium curieae]